MGAITDIVRRYVPASYRAMVGSTNPYYSQADLQALSDYVQARLFSTVVGATLEASMYDIKKRELLGMLTTLQFIPAAVEYWGDQIQSESTTGTHEVVTYFDRRDQLWKLFTQIQKDSNLLAIDLGVSLAEAKASIPRVSYGDNGRHVLTTPDPELFPHQRSRTDWRRVWGFKDPGGA